MEATHDIDFALWCLEPRRPVRVYAQAVEKEHRWLPALAPRLRLAIPVPLAKGGPSADYRTRGRSTRGSTA